MSRLILALDTATEACSCALLEEGRVILEQMEIAPQRHNLILLGMIDRLFAETAYRKSQLEGIVFGRGPGSFTGVRIASSVAKGLAIGLDRPLAGISTLEAMGLQMLDAHPECAWVVPCIDARMDEVYVAAYARPKACDPPLLPCLLHEEAVMAPHLVKVNAQSLGLMGGCGSGWLRYEHALAASLECHPACVALMYPWASTLGRLAHAHAHWLESADALPVYLRNKVVQKPEVMR